MTNPANYHFERAQMLLQTDRINEAEKELRTALSHEPEFARAHALLALCLSHRLKHKAAFKEAETAISLNPNDAPLYFCYTKCLFRARWIEKARQTIEHAISLNPYDADYYYMRAAIELEITSDPPTAPLIQACDTLMQALEIDPVHGDSLALLSRLQAILGKTSEAKQLALMAVHNRPESSDAHVSRGYSLLYTGNARESFDAFREALRLDPNNEMARSGLIEALKIHNVFYRLWFRFSAFITRYQWSYLILGLGLAFIPALVVALYVLLCLVDPISYTTLWLSRWGRLAMTQREKMVGIATMLLSMGCVTCSVIALITGNEFLPLIAMSFFFLLLPVTKAINPDHANQVVFSVAVSTIIIISLFVSIFMGNPELFAVGFLAFIAHLLLINLINYVSTLHSVDMFPNFRKFARFFKKFRFW